MSSSTTIKGEKWFKKSKPYHEVVKIEKNRGNIIRNLSIIWDLNDWSNPLNLCYNLRKNVINIFIVKGLYHTYSYNLNQWFVWILSQSTGQPLFLSVSFNSECCLKFLNNFLYKFCCCYVLRVRCYSTLLTLDERLEFI